MVKKKYDNTLSRFHPILERYGRTDRQGRQTDKQTDGQREFLYQYRAYAR